MHALSNQYLYTVSVIAPVCVYVSNNRLIPKVMRLLAPYTHTLCMHTHTTLINSVPVVASCVRLWSTFPTDLALSAQKEVPSTYSHISTCQTGSVLYHHMYNYYVQCTCIMQVQCIIINIHSSALMGIIIIILKIFLNPHPQDGY